MAILYVDKVKCEWWITQADDQHNQSHNNTWHIEMITITMISQEETTPDMETGIKQ